MIWWLWTQEMMMQFHSRDSECSCFCFHPHVWGFGSNRILSNEPCLGVSVQTRTLQRGGDQPSVHFYPERETNLAQGHFRSTPGLLMAHWLFKDLCGTCSGRVLSSDLGVLNYTSMLLKVNCTALQCPTRPDGINIHFDDFTVAFICDGRKVTV